jgi:4-hydroxybenzoate polyprenyltransferase
MRPYLLFVSGITGIAGVSFIQNITATNALLLSTAAFLSYGFGQALTDCFQTDTDALSAPYRPLVRGVVTERQVLVVSLLGLVFCISVFAVFNPSNLILGALAGIGLATYTPFKRKWWAGPFYNAGVVALLFVMAFRSRGQTYYSFEVFLTLCVVFFGYANFVLAGYFKDISADRATGYNTLPVVVGRRAAAFVSDVFAALTVVSAAAVIAGSLGSMRSLFSNIVTVGFAGSGIVTALVAQRRLHKVATDAEAHSAIALVVHSYILLLSGVASFQKPTWSVALCMFYAAFVLVLKMRPAQDQI